MATIDKVRLFDLKQRAAELRRAIKRFTTSEREEELREIEIEIEHSEPRRHSYD